MLFALRLLARLPLPVLHFMGALAGLADLVLSPRAAVVRANLRQAGMDRPLLRLRAALHFGMGVAELLAIWLRPLERVTALVRSVHGGEHLEAARAAGRGVLAMTPHLGCWELAGLYLASRMPIVELYRPPRQPWADRLMRLGRERGLARLATPDMRGVRALLSALRRGDAVGILPDQVASRGDGVWAPFFGRPAYTPTLAFKLARTTGAVPLLLFCERLPWGRGYRLWIEPLAPFADDPAAAAAQLNTALEGLIRRHPEQYLWRYRRYKRPGDAPLPPGQA
ncbi:MAG: lysophospholipid acyltransferase family protein [Thiobacillaceae bacterium]|nr:lysophospholipid acyltransferase family protein [Thiobacillaceae bacterium]MCX7672105.1 lysophospholipid acyltransferase family protein [Thiobacillaceae bacterium]MDW8323131.1 lysophospholipid acyltransferase family protein [Burkholderiales bacterium]